MSLKSLILLVGVILGAILSANSYKTPDGQFIYCRCPEIYRPACGANLKMLSVYPNKCYFDCVKAKIPELVEIKCEKTFDIEFSCPFAHAYELDYDPICGSNGFTYHNVFKLRCAMKDIEGLKLLYPGECWQSERNR